MAKKKTEDLTTNKGGAMTVPNFGEYAGMGMENVGVIDTAIPFLGIIQKDSPQLESDHAKYIKGCEVGQLFNTVTNEIIGDGTEVFYVACCKERTYVEWIPFKDGGGYCGQHEPNSELVRTALEAAEDKPKPTTDDGHELAETFSVFGLLLESATSIESVMPLVVAFASSKIKVYKKQMMTRLATIKGDPPMFAFRFRITVVDDKNKAGKKFKNFKIDPVGGDMVSSTNLPGTEFEGLLKEGKELVEQVRGGMAKADHTGQTNSSGGAVDEDEHF